MPRFLTLFASAIGCVVLGTGCGGSGTQSAIAFSSSDTDLKSWIYVTKPNESDVRRLTSGWNHSWSPDGEQLVFVDGWDDYSADIYTINQSGGERRLVVRSGNLPVWSPDGDTIAFVQNRDQGPDIHVIDLETHHVRRLTSTGGVEWSPVWSPDGTQLAFAMGPPGHSNRTSIYVIRSDGRALRQLTHAPAFSSSDHHPVWSADGRSIAFDRVLTRGNEGEVVGQQVFVVASDGSDLRRLTDDNASACCPAWSPDGSAIAFTGWFGAQGTDIYVIGSDGHGQRRLTQSRADGAPAWSPDSTQIAFVSARDDPPDFVFNQTYVMSAAGSDERRLSHTGMDDRVPAWSPR